MCVFFPLLFYISFIYIYIFIYRNNLSRCRCCRSLTSVLSFSCVTKIIIYLSLLNIARPNGTMGFRTEARIKNRQVYVRIYAYIYIYIYNCRKISVSCRAAATGSELLSPQRREWYDEPDLKSSSSAFKKRTHHVSHLLTSTFLHR